ncbi:hypothetical protein NFI96_022746 [Prochilodus magdalenae]|nr:hypothetical protein NFI96_022746 [Prochilodus magdalenae]
MSLSLLCWSVSVSNTLCQERVEGGFERQRDTRVLDPAPQVQFCYSCSPKYIPCLTVCAGLRGTTVVGFQRGHKIEHRQITVWTQDTRGMLSHYKTIPMEKSYKIEHLVFVPSQKAFVGACSDLSLRVFSDPGQDMVLQYRAELQNQVLCMHYCKDTEELLTGSLGMIMVWGFWTSPDAHIGIKQVLDWNCSSLCCDSTISALLTEQQSYTLYALCDQSIKCFHLKQKKELIPFHGKSRGNLNCIVADKLQRYLYTGDLSGCVQVWSQDSRSLVQEFRAHSCRVSAMVLLPNRQTLLTSSHDGWVKEWSHCGKLLVKLFLDDLGGVRSMWLTNERQLLCHSHKSLKVLQLQNIYEPFCSIGCDVQYLQRVECGRGQARILAIPQGRMPGIISPVSGEMLLRSWPFHLLKRAKAFAYNPDQEDLFVAFGTQEVLVLDTSLSPCPAKRMLCTSKNHGKDTDVMSLEAVMMARAGTKPPFYLVFSGHRSGNLQLLSAPPSVHCQPRKAHEGAVLQISSLPGPKAQLCCYGEDKQLTVWSVELCANQFELALITRIRPHSRLVLTKLMPGLIFAVSSRYSLLLYSLLDDTWLTIERNPSTAITCMDSCVALGLIAVSGPAGSVEVFDTRGTKLTEIQLGEPVSQVCFANARGDLLACFSDSIFIIPGVRYLPVGLLKQVLAQTPGNDLLEHPLPYLQRSPDSYDLNQVPRIMLKPTETVPQLESPHCASTVEAMSEPELDMCSDSSARTWTMTHSTTPKGDGQGSPLFISPAAKPMQEEEEMIPTAEETELESPDQGQYETSWQQPDVKPGPPRRPIAPDGFIPNSVIRNWGQQQKPQVPIKLEEAKALRHLSMEQYIQECAEVEKVQAPRVSKPVPAAKVSGNDDFVTVPELAKEGPCESLLEKIAKSPWLAKKPDILDLDSVMAAVMFTMDCMDPSVYIRCTDALYRLYQSFGMHPKIKTQLTLDLQRDVQKENPTWKRQEASKALLKLDLLLEKDLFDEDLQQSAPDTKAQVQSINTKQTRLHHHEKAPARQVYKTACF